MSQQAYQKKLEDLRQAFENADALKKGSLTEMAFKEFVQIGYNKECPDGMYRFLCAHYQVDPSQGITWQVALTIWKESNPPPETHASNTNCNSNSTSTAATTNGNNIDNESKTPATEQDSSRKSSLSSISNSHTYTNTFTFSDTPSLSLSNNNSNRSESRHKRLYSTTVKDKDASASTMIVEFIEKELKSTKASLQVERKKRKKADETSQQLLIANEKFKHQLSDSERRCKKLEKELKKIQDEAKKYKSTAEDNRNKITELGSQLIIEKSNSREAFKLLRTMEEQHEEHVIKLKKKHSEEIEKQKIGFLEILGVDASSHKDPKEIIGELKEEKRKLNDQVDVLAQTLARKEQSLIHALEVLDDLSEMKLHPVCSTVANDNDNDNNDDTKQNDELATRNMNNDKNSNNNNNNNIQNSKINKENKTNTSNRNTTSTLGISGLNRRKSKYTADFFRKVSTIEPQDKLDELSNANNSLVNQVMSLQKQLNDMNDNDTNHNKTVKRKNNKNNTIAYGMTKSNDNESNMSDTSADSSDDEDLP